MGGNCCVQRDIANTNNQIVKVENLSDLSVKKMEENVTIKIDRLTPKDKDQEHHHHNSSTKKIKNKDKSHSPIKKKTNKQKTANYMNYKTHSMFVDRHSTTKKNGNMKNLNNFNFYDKQTSDSIEKPQKDTKNDSKKTHLDIHEIAMKTVMENRKIITSNSALNLHHCDSKINYKKNSGFAAFTKEDYISFNGDNEEP